MLAYLLDEHISHVVAEQVRAKRSAIRIECLTRWREGTFRATDDGLVLQAAREEALALVTYDLATIAPLLVEWGSAGIGHAGGLFVDGRSIPPDDFGGLVRALVWHWEAHNAEDWRNRVDYLRPAQ